MITQRVGDEDFTVVKMTLHFPLKTGSFTVWRPSWGWYRFDSVSLDFDKLKVFVEKARSEEALASRCWF